MLKKEFTSAKLNIMRWRAPSDEEKVLKLKEEMSVEWWELGQNVGISDSNLTGFQQELHHSNKKCMNAVTLEWMQKGSQEVNCTHKPLHVHKDYGAHFLVSYSTQPTGRG